MIASRGEFTSGVLRCRENKKPPLCKGRCRRTPTEGLLNGVLHKPFGSNWRLHLPHSGRCASFPWRAERPSFRLRRKRITRNHRSPAVAGRCVSTYYPFSKRKQTPQKRCLFSWWERVDSNHRRRSQQIYSLSPLATRELSQIRRQPLYHRETPLSRENFRFFQLFCTNRNICVFSSWREGANLLYCVCSKYATVAQQVEQLTRNEQVARSNRVSSSKKKSHTIVWLFLFVLFTILCSLFTLL